MAMRAAFDSRFSRARWDGAWLSAVVAVAVVLGGCASPAVNRTDAALVEEGANANTLLLQAEVALHGKQYRRAAQLLTAAAQASDDETLAERAALTAFQHRQNNDALTSATRWLELNPSSEQAHRVAGFAALRLYRIDIAAERFQSLLSTAFISEPAGFMSLAPQWFEEGSRPAVLALMQALIGHYDSAAEAHFVLAQAALQAEHLALALSSAQRAVELSPYWSPGRSLLARVQLSTGDADAGLATARATLEQEDKPELRLEYAQLRYAAGRDADARKDLEALSDSPEVGVAAQRSLAIIDLDGGDDESASRRWRALVQSGRYVYEGLFYLAQIAERAGQTSDAIELYVRVTAGGFAVPAQLRAAQLKARAGTDADGLAVLREFGESHPEQGVDVAAAQANFLFDAGDVDRAVKVLDEALAEYPDHDALRASKALLLERAKRSSDALKEMRILVRERPDDPTALNMLGYTLVDRTRNYQEGYDLIARALQMMPDNGPVLDSMGWALHRLRRDEEALPYLQRAHERARDPEIALHLGEVLWSLDRRDEARKTWEEALAVFPDHADLKEIVRKRLGK
jgi:tetratricopeptide (TPR) repeat protein